MPDSSITPSAPPDDMFDLLARIDALEEVLETMDDNGVTTRDELVALIAGLEAEASRLDAAAGS